MNESKAKGHLSWTGQVHPYDSSGYCAYLLGSMARYVSKAAKSS